MSSSSSLVLFGVIMSPQGPTLEVLWRLGRIRIRRRKVGERARRGLGRLVDAVANDGAVAGVDEGREDRVHDVIVERSSAAGFVCVTSTGGALNLEEGSLLGVRLGDVDGEVVGEQELGQRVGAVSVRGPVGLAVEAVPEGEVGVQARAVGAQVALGV